MAVGPRGWGRREAEGGGRVREARPKKHPQLSWLSVRVESGMKRLGRRNKGARAAAALPHGLEAGLSEGSRASGGGWWRASREEGRCPEGLGLSPGEG